MQSDRVRSCVSGVILALLLAGCSATVARGTAEPPAANRVAPPIRSGEGLYVSPLKADGTLAAWVEEGTAKLEQDKEGEFSKAFRAFMLPVVANQIIDKKIQAETPNAFGGWEHIRATSELSFNSLKDFRSYLLSFRGQDVFAPAWAAAVSLYPEVRACGFNPTC